MVEKTRTLGGVEKEIIINLHVTHHVTLIPAGSSQAMQLQTPLILDAKRKCGFL